MSIVMSGPTIASTHTHMGTPAPDYHQEWVTHTIHVHDFASLPTEQDESVASSEFTDLGHQYGVWS
jgi:hypothetical protein